MYSTRNFFIVNTVLCLNELSQLTSGGLVDSFSKVISKSVINS